MDTKTLYDPCDLPAAAKLQDELTGALIGLARAADTAPAVSNETWQVMIEGLLASAPANYSERSLLEWIDRVHVEKFKVVPDCAVCASPCGRTADYNMSKIWNAPEEIRNLKVLILWGIRGIAAYARRAMMLGCVDEDVNRFFCRGACHHWRGTGHGVPAARCEENRRNGLQI